MDRDEENTDMELQVTVASWVLNIYDAELAEPFNEWRENHLAQGFSWRPFSASFLTLMEHGGLDVRVRCNESASIDLSRMSRVLEVPFQLDGSSGIIIGCEGSSQMVPLRSGLYTLTFACESSSQIDVAFSRTNSPRFNLLKIDKSLSADGVIDIQANAALSSPR